MTLNQVYLGDCIQKMEQMDPGTIHLAFADPPFNIGYKYDVYDDRKSAKQYLDWSRDWIQRVFDCLRPDGTFWLAIGDEFAAELKVISQDIGFHSRSWVIWYYTFGVNVRRGFSRSHTHLFYFVKDPKQFTFNLDNPKIRVPSARQLVYADARANPRGRLPDNTWVLRPQDIPESFSTTENMWYFPRVAGTFKEREGFHGCQMPEQLLGRIIRSTSNPGDIVLDPFAGSGTSLVVAKKLARRWLGFDVSLEYVNHVKRRLKQSHVGDELDGKADPLKSVPKTTAGKRRNKLGTASEKRDNTQAQRAKKEQEALKENVVRAYTQSHGGQSTDHVLADPELNQAFVAACEKLGTVGYPQIWNETLIGLRKQGALPKSPAGQKSRRLSAVEMDRYAFAAEIALQLAETDFGVHVDKLFCIPELAAKFDELASQFAPGFSSFEYRWAAIAFRKKARVAKSAGTKFLSEHDLKKGQLPKPIGWQKLEQNLPPESPGIYSILGEDGRELYVGATQDLRERIAQICGTLTWRELNPKGIRLFPCKPRETTGRRVAWVSLLHPLLNSRMLFLEKVESGG